MEETEQHDRKCCVNFAQTETNCDCPESLVKESPLNQNGAHSGDHKAASKLTTSLPNNSINPAFVSPLEYTHGSIDTLNDLSNNHWANVNRSRSDTALNRTSKTPDGDLTPPYSNFARYLPCLTTPSHDPSSSSFTLSASTVSTSRESDSTVRLPFTASQLSLPEPPDGGYGWVVVAAAFVVHMIIEGVIVSFGIFIEELIEEFNESMSATSWVGSFAYGIPALVTPIASVILSRYGCRVTCILGALISSLGCLVGCFANSLLTLTFSFGILSGLGTSLSMTSALVIVSMYFEDRRATATGLSIAGTGVGALVFAPAVDYLITIYTWRGTFMLMAGALLHIAICGALMRPVETTIERTDRQRLAWLEHLTKESGLSFVIKSEEYLDQDVLGRIKFLRDRLLAPRKCTGRAHAVIKLPHIEPIKDANRDVTVFNNTNTGSVATTRFVEQNNENKFNTGRYTILQPFCKPESQKHGSMDLCNSQIDTITPRTTQSPARAPGRSYPVQHRAVTWGTSGYSRHRQNHSDDWIHSAVDIVPPWKVYPGTKHILKRSVSSPFSFGHPAGPFKSPIIHLAQYSAGFRPCVRARHTRHGEPIEHGVHESGKHIESQTSVYHVEPSAGDYLLSPSSISIARSSMPAAPSDAEHSVPEQLCRVHRGSLLKAFGLKRATQCRALSLPDLSRVHRVRRGWEAGDNVVTRMACCSNWTANRRDPSGQDSVVYDETCALIPVNYLTQCGLALPEIDGRQLCRQLCDVRIFRRSTFDLFLLSNFLLYFWYNVTYFFMGVHALKLGMSETQAALLFSVLGGANMVGEIAVGLMADREWVDALVLYLIMLLACGISTALVPLLHTFVTLSTYTAVFGIGLAANDALCTILLVKFVGLSRLTNALGICFFCQGVANIIGPPAIGFIIDSTGSQNLAFLISGIGLILSALVVIPIIVQSVHRRRTRRQARKDRINYLEIHAAPDTPSEQNRKPTSTKSLQ